MQINEVFHNLQKQHRSSIRELLWKVITLKFSEVTEKHLLRSLFLGKILERNV